jgi:plasmid maintenance system antidote protein VapI
MGKYFVKRPLKRPPVHPGEILREDVLPTLGLSVSEAARRLAGNGPGLWLRMQQSYDLWYAEHRMKHELSKIETIASSGSSAQQAL